MEEDSSSFEESDDISGLPEEAAKGETPGNDTPPEFDDATGPEEKDFDPEDCDEESAASALSSREAVTDSTTD